MTPIHNWSRLNPGRWLMQTFGWVLLTLLVVPVVAAGCISFTPTSFLRFPTTQWSWKWYVLFWSSPEWTGALGNSLWMAALTALISAIAGTGLALLVSSGPFRGRSLLTNLSLAPLFVPGVVLGLSQLLGAKFYGLWGSSWSIVAAHSVLGMPVVFVIVRAVLRELDPNLVLAARGLGASRAEAFCRVTLPLISPAVGLGALLAFIVSFQELIVAIFLCTADTQTLPRVIWPNLRYSLTPLVAAASGVSLLATLVLLLGGWGLGRLSLTRFDRLAAPHNLSGTGVDPEL